ncbi:MAG: bifunctional alpha/beta hydrolase/OsmC family protein [Pseudomonadota bacterium]
MEKIFFTNRRDQKLAGVMHLPTSAKPRAYAVFAHCFTCTKNIRAAVHIADAMAEQGIGVLRFDFTGLGQSEGDFADTHFSSNVDDLVDAAAFLSDHYAPPKILVGHSLGGTAVLCAAHQVPSATAVATIGSPADAEHVLHLLENDIDTIEKEGIARVKLAGRPFTIKKEFVDDLRSQSVRERLGALKKALLVMHSPIDATVSVNQAADIFVAAKHPKSYVSLDDADHLLSRETDSRYAAQVLAAWANRYIGDEEKVQYPKHESDSVVVHADNADGFLCTMNVDGHTMIADEPENYGGSDLGPSPYGYLSAALGACTAMTLNMYARRKKLPLENVTVTTKHDKIHAQDCEACETTTGKIDQFVRSIKIEGDLDQATRQRLLEIADMCPVHKTLHAEVEVVSKLDD